MKCKLSWLLPVLLLASASAFAQTEAAFPPSVPVLHNGDILRMVREGIKPGEIIAKILTSSCAFDTFPPVMKDLEMRGVPDTVRMAMKMVPYGPPAMVVGGPPKTVVAPARGQVKIPAGTVIGIEAAQAVSSDRSRSCCHRPDNQEQTCGILGPWRHARLRIGKCNCCRRHPNSNPPLERGEGP